ncbi:ATP-binding cassette domain-containing protein, partial [bacterium]|nr:ATP-binding cassette domain-containing protein [bacterium]
MDPIVFEKVFKAYRDKVAVKSLDLAIGPNKTTAIIGPSGSGKSTILQLSNGLVRPDRGQIFVFGAEIDYDSLPGLRKQMGYAVQGTGLFPHLTAHENITLLARLDNWPQEKILSRAKDLMSLVDLPSSYSNRYPFELSGGEQQ